MKYILYYLIGMQVIALFLFFIDKQKAIRHKYRIPEKTLFLVAILGGSVGAIAGMQLFRHKTKHLSFRIGLPMILIIQILLVVGLLVGTNKIVISSTKNYIMEVSDVDESIDCIVVLGASVYSDGTPSSMLQDRLDTAIEIYESNPSIPIIVSGYSSDEYYDEVASMKNYLLNQGVDSSLIVEDYYGFSTYDSIYQLKDEYESVVIVTQVYHLYRAMYIALELDIDAYGVACQDVVYDGQTTREVREVLARYKDYIYTMIDYNSLFK